MSEAEPFWKKLFGASDFEWAFRMRKGDAREFFASHDASGEILAERRKWLDVLPEECCVLSAEGEKVLRETWDLALSWNQVSETSERSLDDLGRQWEADFLLMDRDTMTLAGGCVCFASSWNLQHGSGKSVFEVHELVPRLNPQIGEKIDKFLRQLAPGQAFCRENWGVTRSAELNYHPELKREPIDDSVRLEDTFLRVEHQLFTAVPSGVVMGIRVETCPMADLRADSVAWQNVTRQLRTMPADVAAYKGLADLKIDESGSSTIKC